MAIRAPLLCTPQILPKPSKSHEFLSLGHRSRATTLLRCSASDAELAVELASQVAKLNARKTQRREAVRKSGQLLFGDFCKHLGMKAETVKRKWRGMEEMEKLDWVRGFVDEWGANFHPLSLKSVKEMVEEHLYEEEEGEGDPSSFSTPLMIFPGLRRILRFSETKNEQK